jgi:hypothetical protein
MGRRSDASRLQSRMAALANIVLAAVHDVFRGTL